MYRLGVMAELHGEEDVGGDLVPASASASLDSGVSSGMLCPSTMSSLTEDDAESSPAVGDPAATGSSESPCSSDTMQLDGEDEDMGPLYELSPLLAHLPLRTGLSKYYKGKSQSYTSLSDVKCLQHLAKKTTSRISRNKVGRSSILHDVRGPCSKMIAKKTTPRGSSDPLLSRARSRDLLHRSGKPPAYQGKKELCSAYVS
uniref:Uncharacterized protein n=1 Tax=Avena sativa TaxID=4498 RepID=A0ACD6A9B0_AVESA